MNAELRARELRIIEKEGAINAELRAIFAELRARDAELRAKEEELNEQRRLLMEEREAFLKAFEEEMMKKIEEEVKQRRANEIIVPYENEYDNSEFEVGDDLEMYDEDGDFVGDIGESNQDEYTDEELAELERIFSYPKVGKDVDKVMKEAVKKVYNIGVVDYSNPTLNRKGEQYE